MNDWGLPDWRDASAYGDTRQRALVRWRWEFVRRKPEYRSEALAFFGILEARDEAAKAFQHSKTPESRERFSEISDRQAHAFSAFWRRWKYCQVFDPRLADYPDDDLKLLYHDRFNIMDGSPSSEAGQSSISPKIGQTAIIFDLDRPLQKQMKDAMAALKSRQKTRHEKLTQQRQQPKKWLLCLRTLDAREGGKTWLEITETFYAQGLLDRRKDPSGGYCAPPPQAARDIGKAAKALRFNF